MQTKKMSWVESASSTAIGFGISLASVVVIFPWFGIDTTFAVDLGITLYFTVISVIRSYFVRRYFNKKMIRGER